MLSFRPMDVVKKHWAWLLFFGLLAFQWRYIDLFTEVPTYGDVLEVVWGSLWYKSALTHWHSPLFYANVYHPVGWYVGTVAHPPLTFLISQPLLLTNNSAFTYNALVITTNIVAFTGARRFFYYWTSRGTSLLVARATADVAALAWTFAAMRTLRISGHLNILWMTALFGWVAYYMLRMIEEDAFERWLTRRTLLAGAMWGLMINFVLYSIFIGALFLLLIGRNLLTWFGIRRAGVISLIAFFVGLPAIFPFLIAPDNATSTVNLNDLVGFSTNLNSLFLPHGFHPWEPMRTFAYQFYSGPYDESGIITFGITASVLAGIALFQSTRPNQTTPRILSAVVVIATILALGPFLKINGALVSHPLLAAVNRPVLEAAQHIKPNVFPSSAIDATEKGLPLPFLLAAATVPKIESARVVGRYAYVAAFALFALAAIALGRMPPWLAAVFAILWLIESLPQRHFGYALDVDVVHPAHVWLAAQPLAQNEGVLDVTTTPMHGGEVLYGSWQSQTPTASFIGSFLPSHAEDIFIAGLREPFSAEFAQLLAAYRIRYLMVHLRSPDVVDLWESGQIATQFEPLDCFGPPTERGSPFTYPICIARVPHNAHPIELIPQDGWSLEAWGGWTIEQDASATVVAFERESLVLTGEAFPNCVEGRPQTAQFLLNEQPVGDLVWADCESQPFSLPVRADAVRVGVNQLTIRAAYHLAPSVVGTGNDTRTLGVGFSQLRLTNK